MTLDVMSNFPFVLQANTRQFEGESTTLTKPVDMGHMWPNSGNDMG